MKISGFFIFVTIFRIKLSESKENNDNLIVKFKALIDYMILTK